ncbi:cytochrome c oxidase assembly protein ctaG-like [Styela clava]|uniref:cytochrome c oxidase assembly protein COX11, mitochondrial-like n=1 Tax=Styela clava TaxID=7725 RepID=UPI001939C835|nr:cytochrome c oxidase assembly protein COX11, mitochondrial-like [Styela clava]
MFCSETVIFENKMFRLASSLCRTLQCQLRLASTSSGISTTCSGKSMLKILFPTKKLLLQTSQDFAVQCKRRTLHVSRLRFSINNKYYHTNRGSNVDVVLYIASGIIFMIGVSYASVPLYRMFCQATGIGGDPNIGHKTENVSTMKPIRERPITVTFNADRHAAMQWNFKPSQHRVTVVPGETALAFYTAKNPTDTPIVGVATYNVLPFQAGPYFNKIQCFCFEEQWLNPHEEVDMPVFFYIDPEFDNDPQLARVNDIVLSYTFFKAEEGQILPMPGFMNARFKGAQPAPAVTQ